MSFTEHIFQFWMKHRSVFGVNFCKRVLSFCSYDEILIQCLFVYFLSVELFKEDLFYLCDLWLLLKLRLGEMHIFYLKIITGADLGPPTLSSCSVLLFNESFFHKKRYGQNICVYFTLGVRPNHPQIRPWMNSPLKVVQNVLNLSIDGHNWSKECLPNITLGSVHLLMFSFLSQQRNESAEKKLCEELNALEEK